MKLLITITLSILAVNVISCGANLEKMTNIKDIQELITSIQTDTTSIRQIALKNKSIDLIAIIHDKASGLIKEDVYIYTKTKKGYRLLSFAKEQSKSLAKLDIKEAYVFGYDGKGNILFQITLHSHKAKL